MPTFVNVTRMPRSRIVASQPFPQPTCSDANLEPPDVDRKGSWAMQSRRFSGLPLIGILAVIYFIAGKLGLMLASLHASASPVWPPAGIALAAGISTIISPAFGVTSLGVAGFADWANYGAIWLTWWLGDATGDLVFTPLVLLWSVASKRRWNKKEAAEVGALLLLLVLLSGLVFGGWIEISGRNYPIAFIFGPVVIWTAFRFTQRETATGIFILSAVAVWG